MKGVPRYLILFDGVCNLCEKSVQFVIKRDKKKKFKYASLQSNVGEKILWESNLSNSNFDSFVFVEDGQVFTKSTAAIKVATHLGSYWPVLEVFMLIPKFLRDPIYDFVAKNRFRWYGKKEECWVPTPELKDLFID
ncbi:MAG: thiol-disulfide oxidoreductase DCC family protein [Salibacteraceae bacterium]